MQDGRIHLNHIMAHNRHSFIASRMMTYDCTHPATTLAFGTVRPLLAAGTEAGAVHVCLVMCGDGSGRPGLCMYVRGWSKIWREEELYHI